MHTLLVISIIVGTGLVIWAIAKSSKENKKISDDARCDFWSDHPENCSIDPTPEERCGNCGYSATQPKKRNLPKTLGDLIEEETIEGFLDNVSDEYKKRVEKAVKSVNAPAPQKKPRRKKKEAFEFPTSESMAKKKDVEIPAENTKAGRKPRQK